MYQITEGQLLTLAALANRLLPDLAEPLHDVIAEVVDAGEIDPDELIDAETVDEDESEESEFCADCPIREFCPHPGEPESEVEGFLGSDDEIKAALLQWLLG